MEQEKTVATFFTAIGLLYCYYLYETDKPLVLDMDRMIFEDDLDCNTSVCESSDILRTGGSRTRHCKAHNHIVYIKTHKTGSTTLQQVFHMYGYRHKLSFLFNAKSPSNGHIRYSFVSNTTQKRFLPPINVSYGDYANYRNYDMLAAHIRYNRSVLDWYMKPDCKYISIIREPAAQFESAFDFFKMAHTMWKHDHGSHSNHRKSRVSTRGTAIDRFLSNPEHYLKGLGGPSSTVWVSLNNGQMLDLGLNPGDKKNLSEVNKTIHCLSKEMDLVLIAEYFDESLILLKKLLCWSFEDIIYLSQNQRHMHRRIREGTKQNIRKWNQADVILYQHFNNTLWRKIQEYGPLFKRDLATFRKIKDRITKDCLMQSDQHLDKKGIVRYTTNIAYDRRCVLLTNNKQLFYQIWKRQSRMVGNNRRQCLYAAHRAAIRRHNVRVRNIH